MQSLETNYAPLAAQPSGHFPRTAIVTPADIAHANRPSTQMLLAMGAPRKPIYGGTVDPLTVRERRRRNKAGRAARRVHRQARR